MQVSVHFAKGASIYDVQKIIHKWKFPNNAKATAIKMQLWGGTPKIVTREGHHSATKDKGSVCAGMQVSLGIITSTSLSGLRSFRSFQWDSLPVLNVDPGY